MKTVGIIAEYNPFHMGHAYQIRYAREQLGADFVVIAMSGDFVQRGTPALLPKHTRAKMALLGGADLVLEMPVSISTASAELFARGGVQLLDHLNVIDTLCFGSESGDTDSLTEIAHILVEEPVEFREFLQADLSGGMSFPAARQDALMKYGNLPNSRCSLSEETLHSALSSPNNILGIEYCKAIIRVHSRMVPAAIKREGSDYHASTLDPAAAPSASAIRNTLAKLISEHSDKPFDFSADSVFKKQIPDSALPLLMDAVQNKTYITEDDLDLLLHYQLLKALPDELSSYMDVSSSLADRIFNRRNQYTGFSSFTELLKTKELTYTRIQRALLHILLEIRQAPDDIPFARVLGFRKSASPLLKAIKENGQIPLITKLSKADALIPSTGRSLLQETVFASNLYESILCHKATGISHAPSSNHCHKTKQAFRHEYEKPVVIL